MVFGSRQRVPIKVDQWQEILQRSLQAKVKTLTPAVAQLPWQQTLKLFDVFCRRRFQVDVILCTAALKSCHGHAAPSAVLWLLDQIENFSLSPDVIAFNTALRAVCNWQAAFDLFATASERSVQADVVSYATMIGACSNASQWQQALVLLASALQLPVDAQLMGLGMQAWLCAGHWQRALNLFDDATRLKAVDPALFSMAIAACQEGAEWQQAVHLLHRMPSAQAQHRLPAFGASLSACERGGQWRKALHLAKALEQEGLRSNVVIAGTSLSAFGRGFRWSYALHLLKQQGIQMNIITYTAASAATEKAQRWRWAMQLFAETGVLALETNVLSCSAVTSACAERGQWQVAMALNQTASNDYTYNALLRAAQRGEAWRTAWWLYQGVAKGSDVMTLRATSQACEGHLSSAMPHLCSSLQTVETAKDGNKEAMVLDLLAAFGSLDAKTQQRFFKRRVRPVLQRLGGAKKPGVRDPLTLQFSLGEFFTASVLQTSWKVTFGSLARGLARPVLEDHFEPTARAMPAWAGVSLNVCQFSRLVGHGGRDVDGKCLKFLTPVLVEHERLWHAERHALLLLLSQMRT